MSLESEIKDLTKAITALAAAMSPVPQTAPVVETLPAPAAPVMPAPPAFAAPAAPVPEAKKVPFTDTKGLIDWVMAKYKALGATKGALIQNVLVGMGYQNINDVKPTDYEKLVAGVEAIQ